METTQKVSTEIVKEALAKSLNYSDYRAMVKQLAEQNSNTGPEKTESLANYTQLNDKRMNRWDKTLKLEVDATQKINAFKDKVTWLVLTESWCGDASPSLPVMNKISELAPNINLKIVLRDENLELMDAFLTKGARSIPKLIMLEQETNTVIGEWGPRSFVATKMVENYKKEHGKLTAEFKEDLQKWYNKDKGKDILNDLVGLLTYLETDR